jgi:hypothetical protein
MSQVQAAQVKKDQQKFTESKAAKYRPRVAESSKLTPQEFRYAIIGIGERRMQTDEDIQQMVMEANDSTKETNP